MLKKKDDNLQFESESFRLKMEALREVYNIYRETRLQIPSIDVAMLSTHEPPDHNGKRRIHKCFLREECVSTINRKVFIVCSVNGCRRYLHLHCVCKDNEYGTLRNSLFPINRYFKNGQYNYHFMLLLKRNTLSIMYTIVLFTFPKLDIMS